MNELKKVGIKKMLFDGGLNDVDTKVYHNAGFNTLGSELLKQLKQEVKK